MKKGKKIKKRYFIILLLIYAGVCVWNAHTRPQAFELIADAEPKMLRSDGVQRSLINVKVLDNKGTPMSGQKITFKLASGGGDIEVVQNVTGKEGKAIATYTAGKSDVETTASIICTNESTEDLRRTVEIKEIPTGVTATAIRVTADRYIISSKQAKTSWITAKVLTADGEPVANYRLVFRIRRGSGNFQGLRLISLKTDANGEAKTTYTPGRGQGKALIIVSSMSNPEIQGQLELIEQE